jgi:hypothetical protein
LVTLTLIRSLDAQSDTSGTIAGTTAFAAPRPVWQIGGIAGGGFAVDYQLHVPLIHYQEDLHFYSAGIEVGRMVTPTMGSGMFRGRGEAVIDALPYWQARHPHQIFRVFIAGTGDYFFAAYPAYSIHGSAMTPVLFRWNFSGSEKDHFVPWFQTGMGVLWTNQIFPQGYGTPPTGKPFYPTSKWNFTPQVGVGENWFVRPNQNLSLGVRAVHVTNFGLTDYDPGVNVILEFTAGYSWWIGKSRRPR